MQFIEAVLRLIEAIDASIAWTGISVEGVLFAFAITAALLWLADRRR